MPRDWLAWRRDYEDAEGPLARRLAIVQREVGRALATRDEGPIRVLSMCAGDGRDVIGPLAALGAADRVQGRLVELDLTLVDGARRAIAAAGIDRLEIRQGDAGTTTAYAGAVPADLVLVCGVF